MVLVGVGGLIVVGLEILEILGAKILRATTSLVCEDIPDGIPHGDLVRPPAHQTLRNRAINARKSGVGLVERGLGREIRRGKLRRVNGERGIGGARGGVVDICRGVFLGGGPSIGPRIAPVSLSLP